MSIAKPSAEASLPLKRLEELFRRCSPQLHRYIQRRMGRSPNVSDLTQEIFERFLRTEGQGKARNPQAYLFGIASHVVADARMAERQELVTYDSEVSGSAAQSLQNSVPDSHDSVAFGEEILRALRQLPEAHQAALLLTKRDGLTCKEAAARMKTTEGTVRVWVCEARARLKVLLRSQG